MRMAFPHPYLSKRALDGLKHYQYKPGGYTILDVLHTPLWDGITARLPLWLAPNLITLSGLIGIMVSYLINAYYLPDFVGEGCPRWVHVVSAVATIVYVNLDCIDGKQARRTKSSSPLGQLFDHGCDAFSVHLLLANTQVALRAECGVLTALMQAMVRSMRMNMLMVPWLLAHWEEYHTGHLLYGTSIVGVLEANYATAGLSLVSAVWGERVWDTPLSNVVPFLPTALGGYVLRHVFFVLAILGCLANAVSQVSRVLGTPNKLPPNEVGNKELGRAAQLRHLVFAAAIVGLGFYWQADPRAGEHHGQCRLASSTYGVAYALVASQLIMTHMAKEPFTPSIWAYAVVTFGAINAHMGILPVLPFTAALCAGTLVAYVHYVGCVVDQVCAHLGINCLSIKHVQD